MKPAVWNILSIIVILATCALLGIYASVFANPYSALNPFPPPTQVPPLVLPSATATLRSLPPTWTATPANGAQQQPELAPSSTGLPTATGFVLPSFTPTATFTNTPTSTPTVTNTPKPTLTPTKTPKPKPTKTNVPTEAPTPEPTEPAPTPEPSPTPAT